MNTSPDKPLVFFDGDCAFCQASVRIIKRLDWLRKLDFVNSRETSNPLVQTIPAEPERLLEEMYFWSANRTHVEHGFKAIRAILWRLPLGWLVAPFLYLPLLPWLGQKVYLWIAANRFKLVPCQHGACTIQKKRS